MDERVWRVREIARLLNVTRETILKLLQHGTLHGFKVGRDWRVTQAELDRFMQQRHADPPPKVTSEDPQLAAVSADMAKIGDCHPTLLGRIEQLVTSPPREAEEPEEKRPPRLDPLPPEALA